MFPQDRLSPLANRSFLPALPKGGGRGQSKCVVWVTTKWWISRDRFSLDMFAFRFCFALVSAWCVVCIIFAEWIPVLGDGQPKKHVEAHVCLPEVWHTCVPCQNNGPVRTHVRTASTVLTNKTFVCYVSLSVSLSHDWQGVWWTTAFCERSFS